VKLRTTVSVLTEAFAITSPTLDTKGASSNIYLKVNETLGILYLYSTNLASETATKIMIEAGSAEKGEVLVNPSKLKDGLASLKGDTPVELSTNTEGTILQVKASNVKFSLASNSQVRELSERMHAIPSKITPIVELPVTKLVEFIKRSIFCIPNDQTGQRANFSALKICDSETTGEEAFATDGTIAVHVIATTKESKGILAEPGLLIPAVALTPLAALASKRKAGETVAIIATEKKNKVFFKFADGTHFGTLTMATSYPNLKPIMDRTPTYVFSIPREPLKQALGRASSFVSSVASKKIIELEIEPKQLVIRANGEDSLSDTILINYTGECPKESTRVGMNIDNIFNITSSSKSEQLTFGYSKSNEPLVITDTIGDEEEKMNIKYVMMGVRL
jgi:DNA polymerase III sliding clamp (beta) subunit (PCNA family)